MTDKRKYIQDAIDKLFVLWVRRALVVGALIFLLLSMLDFAVVREHFELFLGYRIAIALFLLLIFGLAGKIVNRKALRFLCLAAVAASAVTIEAMILHTGGHHSFYATGMILLTVTVLSFVPEDLPFHSAAAAIIYGVYLLPILMTDPIENMTYFFTANFFMCSIILTVLLFRYLSMQGARKQLGDEYELMIAEKQLRRSEKQYRELVELATSVVLRWDTSGRVSFINDYGARLFGYGKEELAGKNVIGTIVAETDSTGKDLRAMIDGIVSDPERYRDNENENMTSDGRCLWLRWRNSAMVDAQGNLVEILSIGDDITRQKILEKQLSYSMTYLKSIIETEPDGVMLLAPDCTVVEMNPAGLAMINETVSEGVIGHRLCPRIDPEYTVAFAEFAQAGCDGAPGFLIYTITDHSGSKRWLESRGVPFRDDVRNRDLILVVTRDITKRRKAEEEIRRLSAEQKALLDNIASGIFFLKHRVVKWANRKAAAMFGFSLEEITGKDTSVFYPDRESFEQLGRQAYAALAQGKVFSAEHQMKKKDGTMIWCSLVGQAVTIGDLADGAIWLLDDITERKKFEEQLKSYRMHLEDMVEKRTLELDNNVTLLRREAGERIKAEKELQAKEARMRAMLESFDGLIYICSPDYRVEFMNENLVRRTGRNAVGEYCYAVMNKRDTVCPWCVSQRVFRGEIVRYEIQSPIDNRWYHVVNTPIRHDKDSISKLAMFIDITETKKADIALKESEKRYRRLVSSVTDYIYRVTVEDGKPVVTEHGEGCFAVTGYTAQQYEKDPNLWYRMVYTADRDSVLAQVETILTGEKTVPLEHRIVHCNGSIRWVRHIIAPLFDKNRKLLSFDGLISDITEKKLLEEQLEKARLQEEENLKVFSRRLIDVQEEERRSIARELHDQIGQSLTGLKLSVENIADSLPSEQADDMRPIEVSLGELISIVRSISLDLRPAMLDDFGLINTLRWYFERYTLQTGISVDFIGTGPDRRFGPHIEIALYRITQESLTNAARHAAVKNIMVELSAEQDMVTLRIKDQGQGFDMTSPALSVSSGLSIMRERSILLKGTFSLSSEPGKGTEITASLPINDAGDGLGGCI